MRRRGGDWSYYDHPYFPPSTPRQARGGIKAKTKRGAFGESWWARRWIAVLESFHIGARLNRGRNYARRGQVTDIDIAEGVVKARVQGSRATPYKVTIQVKTLGPGEWARVAQEMGREALMAAKLLAGEMPREIEAVFQAAGLSLFPSRSQDLTTVCSCPDWSNPCKHIAAVYYLLGEEFDRDPFLLFRLRGLDREGLLALVRTDQQQAEDAHPEDQPSRPTRTRAKGKKTRGKFPTEAVGPSDADQPRTGGPTHAKPLPCQPEVFWRESPLPAAPLRQLDLPEVSAALLRRLGGFPFWRGAEDFLGAMLPIYENASVDALEVVAELTAVERENPA